MATIATILAICMAVIVSIIRIRATKRPATIKKIILPPLFMSTGFFMFLYEPARISFVQVVEALAVGMLFSILLIKTSKFEVKHQAIYLKQSKLFIFVLFGLLAVRIILKTVIGHHIEIVELSGMFFVLAFGMILPWRLAMLYSYKKLERQVQPVRKKQILPIEQ